MLRRLKADVEKSLPPKHETILFTGMSSMQKKLYKEILLRDIDVVQGSEGKGNNGRTAVLNIVMQLRKCAGHPYLFPGQEDRTLPPLGSHLVENCGKMVLLDKLLSRLKERGHRVLVFTQMTRVLDILEDFMVMRQHSYCRIDGNTTYENREDSIDKFNAPGSDKFCFLLSTRAGGLGINLQTADVVILFDSDWNPQADLQAQDRAHRIGQKKPVQVFRLVTEHTIEEKIVERAQQKLKLDAMVVQSGRLKEKDKLSNEELLQAIRFGADKVFKTKDSSITNDDIDMILDQGRKRTEEMNEKLRGADKGDMYDFKMDSGFNSQTFEGVDYSDAATRAAHLGIFDIGKRERKKVANYAEDYLATGSSADARKGIRRETKFPRHLKLPKMEDWQLYQRRRLEELQERELGLFRAMCQEGQFDGKRSNHPIFEHMKLLDDAGQRDKEDLLKEGFASWTRRDYNAMVRASSKFGRTSYDRIQTEVGTKALKDVEAYCTAFWNPQIGGVRVPEKEYERVTTNVTKGEEKLAQVISMDRCTKLLLETHSNPWEDLEFHYTSAKDKGFTLEEDRYLLCWVRKYGYGQWEAVRLAIRRSDKFRFSYYIRAMSAETVGRRCEQLMRACEREVEALQRKIYESLPQEQRDATRQCDVKLKTQAQLAADAKAEQARKRAARENELKSSLKAADAQIKDLAARQAELQKLDDAEVAAAGGAEAFEKQYVDADGNPASEDVQVGGVKAKAKAKRKSTGGGGGIAQEVPEGLVPELLGLISRAEHKGIKVIVEAFTAKHPNVSKRQAQIKTEELGVREKRPGDARQVWHIRDEHLHLVDDVTKSFLENKKSATGASPGTKRTARVRENALKKLEATQSVVGSSPEKVPPLAEASTAAVARPPEPQHSAPHAESVGLPVPAGSPDAAAAAADADYDPAQGPPKEVKKAFTHYCNGTRREIKSKLSDEDRKDKSLVNSMLKAKWESLDDASLKRWAEEQRKDEERFVRQNKMWEDAKSKANVASAPPAADGRAATSPGAAAGRSSYEGGGVDNGSLRPDASASSAEATYQIPKKNAAATAVPGAREGHNAIAAAAGSKRSIDEVEQGTGVNVAEGNVYQIPKKKRL